MLPGTTTMPTYLEKAKAEPVKQFSPEPEDEPSKRVANGGKIVENTKIADEPKSNAPSKVAQPPGWRVSWGQNASSVRRAASR